MNRRSRFQRFVRYLCAPGVVLALLIPNLVLADGDAVVRLNPASAEVGVGETVTVDVVVDQVSNLFGVEVHLVFDPSAVEVVDADAGMAGVQVALGPFLSPDFTAVNEVQQGAGRIDFAYSAMSPSPAVSGSGVVATITFRGLAQGVSPVTFSQVILADAGANPIAYTTQNGQVTVAGAATPEPTASPTEQPTETPTTVPGGAVLSFSPQSSSISVGQTVEVKLQVSGVTDLYGVEVHLTHGGGMDVTTITPGPCVADLIAQNSVAGNSADYAASLQAPSPAVNGACDLATFAVEGLSAGTHTLQFTSALLSDPNGNPIAVTTYNATVVVAQPGETVTPVPTAIPQCQNILGTHVVRPGESLYAIGRAYGVRPDAIAYCNSIVNPSLIYVGMSLVIPNVPWSPIPPGPVAIRQFGPDVTPCRYYHTVQWGETLFRISARYWVSMWAIAEANRIYNLNYIRAGQVLCIP